MQITFFQTFWFVVKLDKHNFFSLIWYYLITFSFHNMWFVGRILLDCSIRIAIKFSGLDWNWQSNSKLDFRFGLSIHFEKWFWIWINNHIFVMDLDWIDNPKKSDWATSCLFEAKSKLQSNLCTTTTLGTPKEYRCCWQVVVDLRYAFSEK